MADAVQTKILKAIEKVVKDYPTIIENAVEYASNIAVEDIYKKAIGCLNEYYDNYDPYSYNRTDNLWHAILPYIQINKTAKKIKCEVGVEYDGSVLTMYNGSKKYSPTDGYWVLNNYLDGIHPGTNGSSTPRESPYSDEEWLQVVQLYGQIDTVSPSTKMRNFLKSYTKEFDGNVWMYFISEVGNRM